MFPVLDVQGRPIAFGGRTLKDEDAKYINSPETAAYVKGRNLFGLNLTRDEIRRQGFAILVEGFSRSDRALSIRSAKCCSEFGNSFDAGSGEAAKQVCAQSCCQL